MGYCPQNLAGQHYLVLTVQYCCLGFYESLKYDLFDRKIQFFDVALLCFFEEVFGELLVDRCF